VANICASLIYKWNVTKPITPVTTGRPTLRKVFLQKINLQLLIIILRPAGIDVMKWTSMLHIKSKVTSTVAFVLN
jgi:hypothetical protein